MTLRTVCFLALIGFAIGACIAHPELLTLGGASLAMAIPVKDAATAAKKFATRGAAAGGDYANGVRGAGARWQTNAKAGAQNFAQGVQDAITNGRFEKGIDKSGAAHFEDRAVNVGAQRFPQGIQLAESKWAEKTQPYLQTIANINLPPRGPKGDPRNQARSQMVADVLRKKKIAG